jgi:hypothetical protein
MSYPPERRFRSDRRRPDLAHDLHRRLEEKRQQIERRRAVRRHADRKKSIRKDRSEADDQAHPSDREQEPQTPSHK